MTIPLLGWRYWHVRQNGELQGVFDSIWDTSLLSAICRIHAWHKDPEAHVAPEPKCRCGIYAFKNLKKTKNYLEEKESRGDLDIIGIGLIPIIFGIIETLLAINKHRNLAPYLFFDALFILLFAAWVWGFPYLLRYLDKHGPHYCPKIIGAVALDGRLLIYRKGIRAQRAKILCFIKSEEVNRDLEELIKSRYKVPFFENEKEAVIFLSEHASPQQFKNFKWASNK